MKREELRSMKLRDIEEVIRLAQEHDCESFSSVYQFGSDTIQEDIRSYLDNGNVLAIKWLLEDVQTNDEESYVYYDGYGWLKDVDESYFEMLKDDLEKELERNGWTCRHFFTFQRVKELGGNVNAGAKATYIIRAVFGYFKDGKRLTDKEAREAQKNGEDVEEVYLGVKEYCVFNGEQTTLDWRKIDQEDREKAKKKAAKKETRFRKDMKAEEILNDYTRGCEIHYTLPSMGDGCYMPSQDLIMVAPPTAYKSPSCFYSTLFHEMIHATSHKTRLNRRIGGAYGSSDYAKEELVAEFGAALLMTFTDSGVGQTFENSTSYVSGWAKRIAEEGGDFSKLLSQAMPKSIKAVEFILTNGEAA